MPVIVVGADTPIGRKLVEALAEPEREVRAFVTDPTAGEELKAGGVKVAVGDVSDGSHVGGACTNCFSAVLVTEAATDHRERSFATGPDEVLEAWAEAVTDANVTRVIWVSPGASFPHTGAPETAAVNIALSEDPVAEVVSLDEVAELSSSQEKQLSSSQEKQLSSSQETQLPNS